MSYFKTVSKKKKKKKKEKLRKINIRNINEKLNRRKVLNIRLKSENKELRHELWKNLENLEEQATRLQKCVAENGTLKKALLLKRKK